MKKLKSKFRLGHKNSYCYRKFKIQKQKFVLSLPLHRQHILPNQRLRRCPDWRCNKECNESSLRSNSQIRKISLQRTLVKYSSSKNVEASGLERCGWSLERSRGKYIGLRAGRRNRGGRRCSDVVQQGRNVEKPPKLATSLFCGRAVGDSGSGERGWSLMLATTKQRHQDSELRVRMQAIPLVPTKESCIRAVDTVFELSPSFTPKPTNHPSSSSVFNYRLNFRPPRKGRVFVWWINLHSQLAILL